MFWKPGLSNISDKAIIGENCIIHSHVWIGDDVVIGNNCKIQAFCFIPPGIVIGDNVFMGPNVVFTNDKNPPSGKWDSTFIEDNVVIGAGAIIIPGIRIKSGAVIGAGAVVTKDVDFGITVIGNPARPIDTKKIIDIL